VDRASHRTPRAQRKIYNKAAEYVCCGLWVVGCGCGSTDCITFYSCSIFCLNTSTIPHSWWVRVLSLGVHSTSFVLTTTFVLTCGIHTSANHTNTQHLASYLALVRVHPSNHPSLSKKPQSEEGRASHSDFEPIRNLHCGCHPGACLTTLAVRRVACAGRPVF
jgi:hypothetical protein